MKAFTLLGAGRITKEVVIDLAVGVVLHKNVDDFVQQGDALVTIHSNRENVQEVFEEIYAAYKLVDEKVAQPTLIYTEIH